MGALSDMYLMVGAGGIAVIVLVWLVVNYTTKLEPTLKELKEDNARHSEVISNNTSVIKEVSRSNENIARALTILDLSLNTIAVTIVKHDERTEQIARDVVILRSKIHD